MKANEQAVLIWVLHHLYEAHALVLHLATGKAINQRTRVYDFKPLGLIQLIDL